MKSKASSGSLRTAAMTSPRRIRRSTQSVSAAAAAVRLPPKSAISPKTSPSPITSSASLRPSSEWTLISTSPFSMT